MVVLAVKKEVFFMDEEYEILSHEEVERLKREAEKYKKNPLIKKHEDDRLYDAIIELIKELKNISFIFEDVKKQIVQEYTKGEGPDSKLDKLLDQNEHIAKALISLGEKDDKLEEDFPMKEDLEEYEEIEKPVFDYSQKSEEPIKQQKDNFDMDYQSWNYSNPKKPGVSKSITDQTKFNEDDNNQKQTQPKVFDETTSKQEFSQEELYIPSPSESLYEEQSKTSKLKDEESFTPFGQDAFQKNRFDDKIPELKSMDKNKPYRKKKKSFRLF